MLDKLNIFARVCFGFLLLTTFLLAGPTSAHANDDIVLIDVRTSEEFQDGHLVNAVLIPYDQIAEKITGVAPDKSQPIALYCRSGRRADVALKVLNQMGYSQVVNLGGLEDLLEKGYQRAVD